MKRREAVSVLLQDRGEAAVVTGLGSPTYDVASLGDHPRNYYLWGAMGSAVTVGLGLALAQPMLDVIVITGDGEMLMGLGALATTAVQAPPNLGIVVLDNGRYGETGMQTSHTSHTCNLTAIAKACGIGTAVTIDNMDKLKKHAPSLFERGSTRFFQLLIEADQPPRAMPSRDGVEIKLRFQKAIGVDPNALR
jgi:phosphonopyruvate decarboxylase